MKEVMDNGPVQAIFEVHEDFFMYKSGVYQYTGVTRNDPPRARKSAYHSVRIIGWGVDRTVDGDIVKYWICANSWGPDWGENGYFRIIRGQNAGNIETYIIGAWSKITGDITLRTLLEKQRRRRLQQRSEGEIVRRRRRRHHHRVEKKLRSLLTGRRRGRHNRKQRQNRRRRQNRRARHNRRQRQNQRQRQHQGERQERRGRRNGKGGKTNRTSSSRSSEKSEPQDEKVTDMKEEQKQKTGRRPPPTTRMPMLEEVIAALEG